MPSVARCHRLLDAVLHLSRPSRFRRLYSIWYIDIYRSIITSAHPFQCMRKRANKQTKGTVSAVPLSEVRRFDEHHLPTNSFMQNCSFGRERCVLDNVIDSENFSVSQTLASELRIERTSVAEFSRPSKLLNQPIGCFIAFSAHYCVRRNAIQWAPVSLAVAVVHWKINFSDCMPWAKMTSTRSSCVLGSNWSEQIFWPSADFPVSVARSPLA